MLLRKTPLENMWSIQVPYAYRCLIKGIKSLDL